MSTRSNQSSVPGNRALRGAVSTAVVFVLVVAAVIVVWQRQAILDWFALLQYKPSAAIVALADDTTMVGRGRDMFYVSDPQIEGRDAFNQHCSSIAKAAEQGAVLGCYVHQNIYIFDVTDPRLPGVREVTAAHETLHAAYDRLDGGTKARIDSLVQAELDKRKDDADLQAALTLYKKSEPGQELNEMHSILGTEYPDLAPDLEQYYTQYFANRAKIVAYAQGYKNVFAASKTRIANYQQQMDSLKEQIETGNAQLQKEYANLQDNGKRLDALRRSDTAAYNSQVPGYNKSVDAYNAHVRQVQGLVDEYNAILPKVKGEAALQADLNNSLDSRYQAVPAQ